VWALSWLAARAAVLGASRGIVIAVLACCVVAVAVPPAVTTLEPTAVRTNAAGPGLSGMGAAGPGASGLDTSALTAAWLVRLVGVGTSATYRGSIGAAAALCASIGPSAGVLFTDQATAARYAPTVRELCGEPAAVLVTGVTGEAQAVRSIEQAGRRPVLLGPTRASVSVPGAVARRVVSLRTAGDARTLTGAPTGTRVVTYSLWLAVALPGGAV
jgi:hypothetical protein